MCQAIIVKYIGPTNTRETRLRASYAGGSIIVDWNYDVSYERNYANAARVLAIRLKWCGRYAHGTIPDGRHVFLMMPGDTAGAAFSVTSEDV